MSWCAWYIYMHGFVCWSLTSLCHSNGHIETMPAREINPLTALTRIRSQFLRTQWSTSNHSEWTRQRLRPLSHRGWLYIYMHGAFLCWKSTLLYTHIKVIHLSERVYISMRRGTIHFFCDLIPDFRLMSRFMSWFSIGGKSWKFQKITKTHWAYSFTTRKTF